MSWIEFNEKELAGIEEASVAVASEGFKQLESGIYPVTIESAYLRKTDSGAEMFELFMKNKDDISMSWSTCTASGDAKNNARTWTVREDHAESTKKRYGVGTKVPLPGYTDLAQLFASFGSKMNDHTPTAAQVKHGRDDDIIDAMVFKDLTGKQFQVCIQQYEEEYNGNVNVKLDYIMFLDLEGNNEKGEKQEDKFNTKISKTPCRKIKVKAAPKAQEQAAAASGW